MGRQIVRMSRWSGRSLLAAYSKAVTLVFALFCAATGQLSKTTRAEQSNATFKGTVYRASDSTLLSNIKLYLSGCFFPDYGVYQDSIAPEYGIAPLYGIPSPRDSIPEEQIDPLYGVMFRRTQSQDTVKTDENGRFEFSLSGSGNSSRMIRSEWVEDGSNKKTQYYSNDCYYIEEGADSSYTVYLHKNTIISSAVQKPSARVGSPKVITTRQGKTVSVHIPEWKTKKAVASIVNSRGRTVQTLSTAIDGTLHWNTRDVAKGIYFLRIYDTTRDLNLKIIIQ